MSLRKDAVDEEAPAEHAESHERRAMLMNKLNAMRKELEASSANNAEEAERTRPDEEAKWKAEEERARQEQEAKQKAAAERARLLELAKRNEEAERVRREEEAKQKAEQERLGREKEAKKAEEERLRREEEAKKAEEERIRQVEKAKKAEEERVCREEEAKKAEEERVLREEEEAKKAEEERVRREAEAKEKAEQERLRREEEAKKAEEERVRREEEAKKAEEEHVRREAEAKEKAEQERLRREEEAKKAEEERVRRDEKAKKAEEERVRREQEAKKAEEERARQEAEHKRKEEEERVRRAEEAKNKAEEERARLLAPHNQRPSVTEALLEEAVQKTACAAGLFLTKEEESARLVDLADLERRLSEEVDRKVQELATLQSEHVRAFDATEDERLRILTMRGSNQERRTKTMLEMRKLIDQQAAVSNEKDLASARLAASPVDSVMEPGDLESMSISDLEQQLEKTAAALAGAKSRRVAAAAKHEENALALSAACNVRADTVAPLDEARGPKIRLMFSHVHMCPCCFRMHLCPRRTSPK